MSGKNLSGLFCVSGCFYFSWSCCFCCIWSMLCILQFCSLKQSGFWYTLPYSRSCHNAVQSRSPSYVNNDRKQMYKMLEVDAASHEMGSLWDNPCHHRVLTLRQSSCPSFWHLEAASLFRALLETFQYSKKLFPWIVHANLIFALCEIENAIVWEIHYELWCVSAYPWRLLFLLGHLDTLLGLPD